MGSVRVDQLGVRSRTSGAAIAWASTMSLMVGGIPSKPVLGSARGTMTKTPTSSSATEVPVHQLSSVLLIGSQTLLKMCFSNNTCISSIVIVDIASRHCFKCASAIKMQIINCHGGHCLEYVSAVKIVCALLIQLFQLCNKKKCKFSG